MLRAVLTGLFLALGLAACHRDGAPASKTDKAAGTTVEVGALRFELPPGWSRSEPSSPMRVAQATIPGPGGPGELAVFFFGAGQGGGVDANVKRWLGQIDTDPGTMPDQSSFQVNGFTVTSVDATGTLRASSMGMGPKTDLPDQRLMGGVVEGNGGPWFFKVTGPKTTLGPEREHVLAMLRSVSPR